IEEAAARTQARIDSGAHTIVGVNRDPADLDPGVGDPGGELELVKVDNSAVRAAQGARLAKLRAGRDDARVEAALAALSNAAETGDGNMLALSSDAARAYATVGEISYALERVFGRYEAPVSTVHGVYGGEMQQQESVRAVRARTAEFARAKGRRPRLLVAKLGQDGHDRGQKVISTAFADLGFD